MLFVSQDGEEKPCRLVAIDIRPWQSASLQLIMTSKSSLRSLNLNSGFFCSGWALNINLKNMELYGEQNAFGTDAGCVGSRRGK